MRQYCSGGSSIWSLIHPLPGCLQQRVVEEEREPPAGAHHTRHLGDRTVDVVDVLEHEARDGAVERARPANGNSAASARA